MKVFGLIILVVCGYFESSKAQLGIGTDLGTSVATDAAANLDLANKAKLGTSIATGLLGTASASSNLGGTVSSHTRLRPLSKRSPAELYAFASSYTSVNINLQDVRIKKKNCS